MSGPYIPRTKPNAEFPPVEIGPVTHAAEAASATSVEITSEAASSIRLVLTLDATSDGSRGIKRVSAFQDVRTHVHIDFTTQTPLYWIASVLQSGSVSPNQSWAKFTSNSDELSLAITDKITLSHDATGWTIPSYDSYEFTVNVGLGIELGGMVYWGVSALGSPNQQGLKTVVKGYELARSTGTEKIGSPVDVKLDSWSMRLGDSYLLAFNGSGVGTLTEA